MVGWLVEHFNLRPFKMNDKHTSTPERERSLKKKEKKFIEKHALLSLVIRPTFGYA